MAMLLIGRLPKGSNNRLMVLWARGTLKSKTGRIAMKLIKEICLWVYIFLIVLSFIVAGSAIIKGDLPLNFLYVEHIKPGLMISYLLLYSGCLYFPCKIVHKALRKKVNHLYARRFTALFCFWLVITYFLTLQPLVDTLRLLLRPLVVPFDHMMSSVFLGIFIFLYLVVTKSLFRHLYNLKSEEESWSDWQKKEKDANNAIRLNPKDANAYYVLAELWEDYHFNDDAIHAYKEAIRLNPNHSEAIKGLKRLQH